MGKVPQDARGAGSPQLTPAVTGGADVVVVTIAKVTYKPSSFKKYDQPVLSFEEFPDVELRVGRRGTDRLIERFGDDDSDWVGERIPLRKTYEEIAKSGASKGWVYQIPPVEEWDALLKGARRAKAKAK